MIRWMLNKWVSMLLALGLGAALVPATSTDSHGVPVPAYFVPNTNDNAGSNVNRDLNLRALRGGPVAGQRGQANTFHGRYTRTGWLSPGLLDPGTGLAGGEHDDVRRFNIWANGAYSNYEDTLSSTSIDGETWNATGGVDYLFLDWLIAGLSLGYEDSNLDTNYNRGHVDTDGVTVSPYVLFLLNRYISVDGAVGYSNIDIDQDRTLPGTATVVTSSLDAERFFGSAGINASFWRGNWNFSGRLGYTSTPPRTTTPSWRATAPSTPTSTPSSGRRS